MFLPASTPRFACRAERNSVRVAVRAPSARRSAQRRSLPVLRELIPEEDMLKMEFMLDRFKLFDADGNGKLDRDELRSLLQSVDGYLPTTYSHQYCKDWLPDKELDRILRLYDKDNNGVIDVNEFEQLVYDGLLLDSKLREYEEAFFAADKNGDGAIDVTELGDLLKSLGQQMTAEKLDAIMHSYDVDKSGKIEFGEFLTMFRDELLDLQEVMDYMATKPHSVKGLQGPGDDVKLVQSEQELEDVMMDPSGKMTVLFTTLTWCHPSQKMLKHYALLAQHYKGAFNFVKLYGNSNEDTKTLFRDKLRVRSTPAIMIFQGTKLLYTQTGTDKGRLETALRTHAHDDRVPDSRIFFPIMV